MTRMISQFIRTLAFVAGAVLFAVTPAFAAKDGKRAAARDQELVIAYSLTEPGTEAVLVIRNNLLDRELVIQPVLRSSNGEERQGHPLTLRAREVQHVPLSTIFGGIVDDLGTLLFRFNSGNSQNVSASVLFQRATRETQPAQRAMKLRNNGSYESHVV